MTRVLVTGAPGFVGPYLVEALRRSYESNIEIIATGKDAGHYASLGPVTALDITDYAALEAAICSVKPTHVVNLAALAAPTAANADPEEAWRVHLHGTLNLARVILKRSPDCWLIHVGSGLVYGESAKAGRALDEEALLVPLDEYSASKAAADLALGPLIRAGLRCIRLRPFNHTGPGQSGAFVVPALAMQIARIEAQLAPPVIRVGNLDAQRDFLDVQDVANAYALVMKNLASLESGTVLNIASGIPRRISDILAGLVARSRIEISVEQDRARWRPGDLPIIVGDAGRARARLGWKPEHSFEDTLTAVLNDWRARVVQ
ncbi:MAG TPA: GDP-mannose 4,6-dehydratase [Pseudolabrys sp.]|jgi:GDP-4-dehydro-6-deoxy-D-mannose reductase